MGPLSRVMHTRDEATLGGRTCGFDLTCRPQLDESLVKTRQFIDYSHHRYKSSGPVLHRRSERAETNVAIQIQPLFDSRDEQVGVAVFAAVEIHQPRQAGEDNSLPLAWLDRQE